MKEDKRMKEIVQGEHLTGNPAVKKELAREKRGHEKKPKRQVQRKCAFETEFHGTEKKGNKRNPNRSGEKRDHAFGKSNQNHFPKWEEKQSSTQKKDSLQVTGKEG